MGEKTYAKTVELPINWKVLDLNCPVCGWSLVGEYSDCRGIPSRLKCQNYSCPLVEQRYEWPTIMLRVVE